MTTANLHLLRGDDRFSVELRVRQLINSLGADFDPAMNLSRLDGKTTSLEDIQMAISTLPFFGSSRLVIVDAALSKVDKSQQEKFIALLASLPPVNHLVLMMEDHQKWKKDANSGWMRAWETLTPSHWLVKWLVTQPSAEIIDCSLPDEKEMDRWVTAEVKRQGGLIEPEAARELARHVGNDTSIASQEIAKLLMYVDFKRQVTQADVLELVSEEGSADVFKMLDMLMDGKAREAQAMMHQLLDDSPAEVILGAVIHRFRQLIQVREVLDERGEMKDLVTRKVLFFNQVDPYTRAARRYPMRRLEAIYRRLLQIDVEAKTSRVDLATNLETFVVEASN